MHLQERVKSGWDEFSQGLKRAAVGVGLPLAIGLSGYAAGCQPPRRGNFGGGGYSDVDEDSDEHNYFKSPRPKLETIIPRTTRVLDGTGKLISISDDKRVLRFRKDSQYAVNLEEGDIIAAGRHDKLPEGLLRKVTATNTTADYIEITTKSASLDEAIEQGTFEWWLNTGNFPVVGREMQALRSDGTETKTLPLRAESISQIGYNFDLEDIEIIDGVTIDATAKLALDFYFRFDISGFKVQYLKVVYNPHENVDITGTINKRVQVDESTSLEPLSFMPLTFKLEEMPVVIRPEVKLIPFVTVDGTFTARAAIHQEGRVQFGAEYDRNREGRWKWISEAWFDFGYDSPTLSGCGEAKMGVRPQLGLRIFGTSGVFGGLEGYLKAEAQDDLSLYAGVNAYLQVIAKIFGKTLLDTDRMVLYEDEKKLWSGRTPCRDTPGEGEREECTSNSSRRCENGNLSQYNSCNELERVIECENGCERGGRECKEPCVNPISGTERVCDGENVQVYNSCRVYERTITCENGCEMGGRECNGDVGRGNGWTFVRKIDLPRVVLPNGNDWPIATVSSLAWDGSSLWYIAGLHNGIRDDLCILNRRDGVPERCIEDISEEGDHDATIAFANGRLYLLEHDNFFGNRLYTVDRRTGEKEFIVDISERLPHNDDYSQFRLHSLTAYNNTLQGLRYSRNPQGNRFCTVTLPVNIDCSEPRNLSGTNYIIQTGVEEFFFVNQYDAFGRISGSFSNGVRGDIDDLNPANRCNGWGGSTLVKAGDALFIGCSDPIILEYQLR